MLACPIPSRIPGGCCCEYSNVCFAVVIAGPRAGGTGGGRSGKDEGGAGGDTDPDKPTAGNDEIYAVGDVDVYGDVGDDLLAGAVDYGGEGEDTLDALASEYSPIFVDFVSGEDVIAFDVAASDLALSEVTIVDSPPGATYPTRLNCASTILWSKRSGWVVRCPDGCRCPDPRLCLVLTFEAGRAPAATLAQPARAVCKIIHDLASFILGHIGPQGDLTRRAQTAGAQPLLRVDHADLHTGAFDLVAVPDIVFHHSPFRSGSGLPRWRIRSSAP